jgi:hypothetical protein
MTLPPPIGDAMNNPASRPVRLNLRIGSIRARRFDMRFIGVFGIAIVYVATAGWLFAHQREAGQKLSIEMLINDLSSGDGGKRTAASAEIFRRGKAVLPDLKKAGAKQVAPVGGTVDGTRRLDMVYSILEGFPLNRPKARAGYRADIFGLHVEKGTTADDVQKICQKYQCMLVGKFNTESRPNCTLKIGPGQALEAAIQQILEAEPKVTTISLYYFEG